MATMLARTLTGMFGGGGTQFSHREGYLEAQDPATTSDMLRPVHLSDPWSTREAAGGVATNSRRYVVKAGSYDGERKDGKRHGKGSYMWACGQKYDGNWFNDVRCGEGTETWYDGRKYHGQWKDDMFHGDGVFTWADGKVFKGKFQHYCPVEGLLYLPDGSMYEVKYSGDTPVFDGTAPMPVHRKRIRDQRIVETHFESMYQELSKSRVFSQMLREQFIKYDDVELSHSAGVLSIDEIVVNSSEELHASMKVRFSFEVRRMSADPQRQPGAIGRTPSLKNDQMSKEISRISMEMSRRVSDEMQRIAMRVPSVDKSGLDESSLLHSKHALHEADEIPMHPHMHFAPQPRAIAA